MCRFNTSPSPIPEAIVIVFARGRCGVRVDLPQLGRCLRVICFAGTASRAAVPTRPPGWTPPRPLSSADSQQCSARLAGKEDTISLRRNRRDNSRECRLQLCLNDLFFTSLSFTYPHTHSHTTHSLIRSLAH